MFPAIKAVVQLLCKILQLTSPEVAVGNKYPNEDSQQKDSCKQNKAKTRQQQRVEQVGREIKLKDTCIPTDIQITKTSPLQAHNT